MKKIIIEFDGLKVGNIVFEKLSGTYGIVTRIQNWGGQLTAENHGTIEILRFNSDYFEHYSIYGWKDFLTIIDLSKAEELEDTIDGIPCSFRIIKLPKTRKEE